MQGSFTNRTYEAMTNGAPIPAVGMDATVTFYTDRHAATVSAWDEKTKVIAVQEDTVAIRDGAAPYTQDWICTPNENGAIRLFRLNKKNRWDAVYRNSETGRLNKIDGWCGLILGFKDHHYDYEF